MSFISRRGEYKHGPKSKGFVTQISPGVVTPIIYTVDELQDTTNHIGFVGGKASQKKEPMADTPSEMGYLKSGCILP